VRAILSYSKEKSMANTKGNRHFCRTRYKKCRQRYIYVFIIIFDEIKILPDIYCRKLMLLDYGDQQQLISYISIQSITYLILVDYGTLYALKKIKETRVSTKNNGHDWPTAK